MQPAPITRAARRRWSPAYLKRRRNNGGPAGEWTRPNHVWQRTSNPITTGAAPCCTECPSPSEGGRPETTCARHLTEGGFDAPVELRRGLGSPRQLRGHREVNFKKVVLFFFFSAGPDGSQLIRIQDVLVKANLNPDVNPFDPIYGHLTDKWVWIQELNFGSRSSLFILVLHCRKLIWVQNTGPQPELT